jgi:hypothetical protein
MITYQDDERAVIDPGQLFPNEICDDLWVDYYATSSIFEEEIDENGLCWRPSIEIAAEVTSMIALLDECRGRNNITVAYRF